MALAEKIAYLNGTKDAIRLAIAGKGVEIDEETAFRAYAAKIQQIDGGGGSAGSFEFPAVSYSGEYVRRVTLYGDEWYYEWELRTSGTLSAEESFLADFYLLGGGGASGGLDEYSNNGGNGGAGYPLAESTKLWTGEVSVVVGASDGDTKLTVAGSTKTAAKGGSGQSVAGGHGTGFTGTYLAYGDAGEALGSATAAKPDGLSGLSVAQSSHMGYSGYGAGGKCKKEYGMYGAQGQGVQGVVLMRIKVVG